jgi:hypothetical protein
MKRKCFGLLNYWSKSNIQRLLRQLVIDEYLAEDIIQQESRNPFAYLRLGPQSESLLKGEVTIQFPLGTEKAMIASERSTTDFLADITEKARMSNLRIRCFNELSNIVKGQKWDPLLGIIVINIINNYLNKNAT